MSKIHPTAIIDETAVISNSALIGPYCVIGPEVNIGDMCELNSHVVIKGPTNIGKENKFFSFAVIGEDTPDLKFKGERATLEIGDKNVFREFSKVHRGTGADLGYTKIGNENLIMPGVMIAHDCVLGDNNTLVHQFCVLGSYSFTGMGSLISMDVPAFTRVAGNPIKQAGLNSIGLERKSFTKEQISNLKKAYKIFFREGLRSEDALEKISNECQQDENIEIFVDSIKSSSRGVLR